MSSNVSVVIPTYNGAAYIASSLQSIFAQTELPAEIIVADDCSTDETPKIVQSVATESPVPLRLISLPGNSGGPSRPLNTGIEAAKGEVVMLLDQDDLMRPRKIAVQRQALEASPQCSIVISRFAILDHDEDDMSPMWPVSQLYELEDHLDEKSAYSIIDSETAFKPLLSKNYAGSSSNFCFTKKSWQAIGKFDETVKICNDLDFMLRAALAGPIAIVNEKLFDYRWQSSSLQRRDLTKSMLEATIVRLRATSVKPEWAGEQIEVLRYSALILANAAVRKGDFHAVRALGEVFVRHKGFLAVKKTVDNKTRRMISLFTD